MYPYRYILEACIAHQPVQSVRLQYSMGKVIMSGGQSVLSCFRGSDAGLVARPRFTGLDFIEF